VAHPMAEIIAVISASNDIGSGAEWKIQISPGRNYLQPQLSRYAAGFQRLDVLRKGRDLT
jgi:hypothetical protein